MRWLANRRSVCCPAKVEADPGEQVLLRPAPARDTENRRLPLFGGRSQLVTVEEEKRLESRVSHALVPIAEGVVVDQGEREGRRRVRQLGIQTCPARRLAGQGDCGLQGWESAEAGSAPGGVHEAVVKVKHLTEGEVPHYARRRYSSAFFSRTRRATRSNSAVGKATRSRT